MATNRFTNLFRVLRFDDAAKRRRQRLSNMSPIREAFQAWADTLKMLENATMLEKISLWMTNCLLSGKIVHLENTSRANQKSMAKNC